MLVLCCFVLVLCCFVLFCVGLMLVLCCFVWLVCCFVPTIPTLNKCDPHIYAQIKVVSTFWVGVVGGKVERPRDGVCAINHQTKTSISIYDIRSCCDRDARPL